MRAQRWLSWIIVQDPGAIPSLTVQSLISSSPTDITCACRHQEVILLNKLLAQQIQRLGDYYRGGKVLSLSALTCGRRLICSFRSYKEASWDISTSPIGSSESLSWRMHRWVVSEFIFGRASVRNTRPKIKDSRDLCFVPHHIHYSYTVQISL